MKTPPEDHELIRWLDGEMSAAESERFTARLNANPALKQEAEMLRKMGSSLRAHLPAELPVPHPDFFNSQIQVRIAQEEASGARMLQPKGAGWLSWLRMPSLATGLAVAAAVVIAGVMIWQQGGSGQTVVLSTYAPDPGVQARTFHSQEAQATVLMLEGLQTMPADRKLVGYQIERSERHEDLATTFYGKGGEAVLVVSQDVRHQPRLLTASH